MTAAISSDQLQYLVNQEGERTAVILPIQEWEQILSWYKQSNEYQEMKAGLKSAFAEVRAIETGKQKKRSLDDLLKEIGDES